MTRSGEGRYQTLARLAALALILVLTLVPTGSIPKHHICFFCGVRATAGFLLNIALFIPFGAALVRPGSRWRVVLGALALGAALSASIEIVQLAIPGRYTSFADFLSNSVGAGLGALVSATSHRWLRPPTRIGGWLALGWSFLVAVVAAGTALLLVPNLPGGTYYVQWSPELGQFEHFDGRILSARVREFRLDPVKLRPPSSVGLAAALADGPRLEARLLPGRATRGLAAMITVFDGKTHEIYVVGREGNDLLVRLRRRADALGFDRPELRVGGLFSGLSAGDTVRLRVWASSAGSGSRSGGSAASIPGTPPRGLCASLGSARRCDLGYHVGRGWALLRNLVFPEAVLRVVDAVWIGLLFIPLGWWAGPDRRWKLSLLVAGGAILAAPALGPLLFLGPAEAFGALGGLAAGHGLRRWDAGHRRAAGAADRLPAG